MKDVDDGLVPSQRSWLSSAEEREFVKTLSIAPNPTWLEISREELRRRQYALSSLLGRLRSKENVGAAILSDDEWALLESVYEMHVELLK